MFGRRPEGSARNQLGRFALRFVLYFALVAALWPFVVPAYNHAIVACAGVAFSIVEEPNVTQLVAHEDEIRVMRRDPAGADVRPFSVFTRYVYVGLVPLLTLLLATPRIRWLKRAKLLVLGVLLLALFHVIYVVLAIRLSYVSYGLTQVGVARWYFYDWVQVLFRVVWDIIAILIWVGLTFRIWRPRTSTAQTDGSERTSQRARGAQRPRARGPL